MKNANFKITRMIFAFTIVLCCSNYAFAENDLPENLEEAILFFEEEWDEDLKEKFESMPEDEAVTESHFGVGRWIRNTWIHGGRNPVLTSYFDSLGIYHPDDMSSIILTSLHRKLNNKEIDLAGQVQEYKSYWEPIIRCEEDAIKKALEVYHKYDVNSEIKIYMPVSELSDGSKNAVLYDCPKNEWEYNPAKDLMIEAKIIDKYFINDSSNVFFKVTVDDLSRDDTRIFMEFVHVGDTVDFNLRLMKIVGAGQNPSGAK